MVDLSASDLTLPRNIYDQDFDEDCTSLPPAQQASEPTEIAFLLAKTRLAFGFSRAAAEIKRASFVKWDRILELDRELRQIYDAIPDVYKLGLLSANDSLIRTSAKMTLANIHYKSLCVVHSRFMEADRSDQKYMYSRKVCLNSAMSMLRIQAIQDQEIPVDGRVRSLTNYQTSLTIHDFLLATAIISSDLSSNSPHKSPPGIPSRGEMIKALSLSADIFGRMSNWSKEANKAAGVLSMLVAKFEAEQRTPGIARDETTQWMRDKQRPGKDASTSYRTQYPSGSARISTAPTEQHARNTPNLSGNFMNLEAARLQRRGSSRNNLWDHSSIYDYTRTNPHPSVQLFDLDLDSESGNLHSDSQAPSFSWPAESNLADASYQISHHGTLHDSQPSQLLDLHQWYPSIAMNDPLGTLFDLNSDLSNDMF
jgi:hypothetical protein